MQQNQSFDIHEYRKMYALSVMQLLYGLETLHNLPYTKNAYDYWVSQKKCPPDVIEVLNQTASWEWLKIKNKCPNKPHRPRFK